MAICAGCWHVREMKSEAHEKWKTAAASGHKKKTSAIGENWKAKPMASIGTVAVKVASLTIISGRKEIESRSFTRLTAAWLESRPPGAFHLFAAHKSSPSRLWNRRLRSTSNRPGELPRTHTHTHAHKAKILCTHTKVYYDTQVTHGALWCTITKLKNELRSLTYRFLYFIYLMTAFLTLLGRL